jgi:hypothetical protein
MKRTMAILVAASLAVASVLVAPQPAMALTLGTCPAGTSTITYTPGLTDTPQEVFQEGEENSGPCVFLIPFGNKSFKTSFSGELVTSCTDLLGQDEGSQTFYWSDGKKSYWNFSSITSTAANGNTVATYTGRLTTASQFLPGAQVIQVITYTNLTLDNCDEEPLTEQTGTSTYTFTNL